MEKRSNVLSHAPKRYRDILSLYKFCRGDSGHIIQSDTQLYCVTLLYVVFWTIFETLILTNYY